MVQPESLNRHIPVVDGEQIQGEAPLLARLPEPSGCPSCPAEQVYGFDGVDQLRLPLFDSGVPVLVFPVKYRDNPVRCQRIPG